MKTKYLMENSEEALRLEMKTDPEAVRKQAEWCGVNPGMRILDAGCGPGVVSDILNEFIQPEGEVVGIDYSEKRIEYAKERYPGNPKITYIHHDVRKPLNKFGSFDLIWARFLLEYNRTESKEIVKNLSDVLNPGGVLCLMDLDYNCLSHYELSSDMENILSKLMELLEREHNFDPYAGRKLYSYIYDLGYCGIRMNLVAHHLLYGNIKDSDIFNWIKKLEVATIKAVDLFEYYPGGGLSFFRDFRDFFLSPRRFTYTPLIICTGSKPSASP